MSTPKAPEPVAAASTATTVQKPVTSGNKRADAEAAAKKLSLKQENGTASILTSGSGILDETNLKKNSLGQEQ